MTSILIANWRYFPRVSKVSGLSPCSQPSDRSCTVHEDAIDSDTRTTELEKENEALRGKLEALERELHCRSPTKSPRKPQLSSPGKEYGTGVLGTALFKLNGISLTDAAECKPQSPSKTPGKKMRKLTARKWDLMDENEMDAFENNY